MDHPQPPARMIRVVLCTFPDEEAAAEAARTLVSENLAACGTLLPGARSIYCWEGKIEDAREVVVIFKISAANEKAFAARLLELHPYDVPEIISLPPSHVHEAYAQWVLAKNAPIRDEHLRPHGRDGWFGKRGNHLWNNAL